MEPATPIPALGRLIALDSDVERRDYLLIEDVYTIGRLLSWCQIVGR